MAQVKWYGYLHSIGLLQLRQYLGEEDILETRKSPMVLWIYGPFYADTYDDGERILREMFNRSADPHLQTQRKRL